MNYSLFIARRLLKQKRGHLSGPVVKVATTAVALGVAVMIISLSVGLGFKQEIRNKIVGFGTHIQVTSYDYNRSYETNPIYRDTALCNKVEDIDGVRLMQPFIVKPGIIKTDDAIQGIALKGIDSTFDWSFIRSITEEADSITLTADTLPILHSKNGIVISRSLANLLKLRMGDPVRMYFIHNSNIKARKFNVEAIFNSHFPEFDDKMAFVAMEHLTKLNGWDDNQISGYEVLLNDFDKMDKVASDIALLTSAYVGHDDTFLKVQSIRDIQPQIFGWLNLLDTNIVVILALIIIVASLNMISGLLILILENTNTIGLLKAMGSRNSSVRHIFVYMAIYIIGKGVVIGNIVGLVLCIVQQQTGMASLDPENYYLDTVPILLSPLAVVLTDIGTIALTTIMLIGPSYIVSRISPAKSIRFN